MNAMYAEAEKAGCSTYCEGCMACLTAYLIYICTETHYEKVCFKFVFIYIKINVKCLFIFLNNYSLYKSKLILFND
jgi:hypothetical protein